MKLMIRNFSEYHIDTEVEDGEKGTWRMACFYGEANCALRYQTWDMMWFLRAETDMPWMCLGGFNEVLRPEEQFGLIEMHSKLMISGRWRTFVVFVTLVTLV